MEKEKLKKQVKSLNDLLSSGKIKESEFESLVIQGFNSKAVEVWKDAYKVAEMVAKKRSPNLVSYELVGQILTSEVFEEVYDQKFDNESGIKTNDDLLKTEDNSICEQCLQSKCLCKSVKIDFSDKEVTKDQLEEAVETLEKYADKVRNSMFLYDRELFGKTQGLRQNLEKLGLVKLKNPVFKRVEDKLVQDESKKLDKEEIYKLGKEFSDKFELKRIEDEKSLKKSFEFLKGMVKEDPELFNSMKECEDYLVDEEVELTEGKIEQIENLCAKESAKPIQCTDCGSPERNMTELKVTASAERQREIQRQVKLGETIQFQNHIQFLTDNMRDANLSYADFYHESNNKKLSLSLFVEIKRLFDWAMERKPTATIEIKELALLLQACEDWHANGRVRKSTEYVEWFKQRMEWLEDQKFLNAITLQRMLSDNDSLLGGLKKKNKQIPGKCNCDENSECTNCPPQETKNDYVMEFTDKDRSITANEIRWVRCSDGSKIQQFYKDGVLVKEEKLEKVIPNKVKHEFDENGLEKRSYYKDGQFVRSVDAFGDVSDKPKNPVVARNIEEIAKKQRETSPLWKSLEGVSKSPFLTGDLKEAAKTLQKYSKILEDGSVVDAKDFQEAKNNSSVVGGFLTKEERQERRDRIKKYRTKTEDEWKNSINNTERILEKKNKPEELSVYEQIVKARQDKTLGEASGNDLEQAAKILQKYAEIVDDNISYQEDNFTATPVDVKGTDGPFRRKLPNKIESNVVEKQDRKSKLNELIRSISQAAKNGLIPNSAKEKNKKFHELSDPANSDKAEKFIDGIKSSVIPMVSKPMFDLSLWQRTKVYFRDLKNKTLTLFKSPEITEEEVDRAIQLMEKQIAEIKKSKNPTPEMYAHLFDHLLPGKGGDGCDGRKYPVTVISELIKKREEKIHNDKVKLDQKTKDLLLEFKKKIERLKSDQDSISDIELIEIETMFYLDAGKLLDHIGINNDRNKFPDLQRYFTSVAIYHHEVSSKNQINIKELKNVYSDFLDKIEWISLKQ